MGTSYYRTLLAKKEQDVYDSIVSSLRRYESKITCPPISVEVVDRILSAIRLDRPEMFFLDNNTTVYCDIFKSKVEMNFYYSLQEAKQILDKLNCKANEIVSHTINMPIPQRAIYLHDYLVKHLIYSDKVNRHSEAHNIVGALLLQSCVCEGYAKAYKFLCDKAGVPCMVVNGTSLDENNIREGHAWNIVMLGQTCYHVDVTFDNFVEQSYCSRAHMFLSTADILTNHTIDRAFSIPNCPKSRLPMLQVNDMNGFVAAVRKDQFEKLRFSEYALSSYVNPRIFIDAFMKKLSFFDLALHNRIRGFFYSDCPKVNVIGVKWR